MGMGSEYKNNERDRNWLNLLFLEGFRYAESGKGLYRPTPLTGSLEVSLQQPWLEPAPLHQGGTPQGRSQARVLTSQALERSLWLSLHCSGCNFHGLALAVGLLKEHKCVFSYPLHVTSLQILQVSTPLNFHVFRIWKTWKAMYYPIPSLVPKMVWFQILSLFQLLPPTLSRSLLKNVLNRML